MNSVPAIQHWQVTYLVIAMLFAVTAVVVARHLRIGDPPSVASETAIAVLAGALWPVMIIGLAQLGIIHQIATRPRAQLPLPGAPAQAEPVRVSH